MKFWSADLLQIFTFVAAAMPRGMERAHQGIPAAGRRLVPEKGSGRARERAGAPLVQNKG